MVPNPNDDFEKYKVDDEKCIELYHQLHFKEAQECFEKNGKNGIMIFTGSRGPFYRGAVLLELERYQDAIDWFDQALKFEQSEQILYHKGLALSHLGKHQDAIEYLSKALKINPNYLSAMQEIGLVLDNSGRAPEAIVWYNKALELDPKNVDIIFELEELDKPDHSGTALSG